MCRAPWGEENGLAAVKPLQRKGFDGVKDMEIFGMLV
jgi:hypothetical protein